MVVIYQALTVCHHFTFVFSVQVFQTALKDVGIFIIPFLQIRKLRSERLIYIESYLYRYQQQVSKSSPSDSEVHSLRNHAKNRQVIRSQFKPDANPWQKWKTRSLLKEYLYNAVPFISFFTKSVSLTVQVPLVVSVPLVVLSEHLSWS